MELGIRGRKSEDSHAFLCIALGSAPSVRDLAEIFARLNLGGIVVAGGTKNWDEWQGKDSPIM